MIQPQIRIHIHTYQTLDIISISPSLIFSHYSASSRTPGQRHKKAKKVVQQSAARAKPKTRPTALFDGVASARRFTSPLVLLLQTVFTTVLLSPFFPLPSRPAIPPRVACLYLHYLTQSILCKQPSRPSFDLHRVPTGCTRSRYSREQRSTLYRTQPLRSITLP